MTLKIKLLLVLVCMAITPMAAQVTPTQKDTVKEKRDRMYQNLENYSKNRKFTKFVHKLIFRSVKEKEPAKTRKETTNLSPEMQVEFAGVEGKIIRNIEIVTLDPFGYSVSDTTKKPNSWLENVGNDIHLKTKELTIKNLLIFKKNQPLDSLLIKESERLIRRQRFTRKVLIKPVEIANSKDSVDVYIRVLDSWSLIPNGSASTSRTSIELTERNFFGLGHEFRNEFDKHFSTGETGYLARYTVPNIVNTYIDASVSYEIWQSYNSLKSFGVQREFFSPFTKWAGGVYIEARLVRDSLPDAQNDWAIQNFKSESQDYWAGYSFKIFEGESEEERTTNLITTGRFFNRIYKETPTVQYDSVNYFANERLFMASVGLTSRKFVQDKFLFNYDIVEDIPIGKVYSLTSGIQTKNNENRLYLGGRYAFGNYYKWGFLSANAEVGSFFYNGNAYESTIRLDLLYFTNIKKWGSWRFRHFVQPVIVYGDNRVPIIKDQLNINEGDGISGFDSRTLLGTKKLLLTLQTQSYSPWNLFGFRLNPFFSFTMGMISDEQTKLYESKVYSKIGLGILIYNDYLVFNSFQLSMAFYPSIPEQGTNIFKTNTFRNTDILLPDYQVGKPVIVPYN